MLTVVGKGGCTPNLPSQKLKSSISRKKENNREWLERERFVKTRRTEQVESTTVRQRQKKQLAGLIKSAGQNTHKVERQKSENRKAWQRPCRTTPGLGVRDKVRPAVPPIPACRKGWP